MELWNVEGLYRLLVSWEWTKLVHTRKQTLPITPAIKSEANPNDLERQTLVTFRTARLDLVLSMSGLNGVPEAAVNEFMEVSKRSGHGRTLLIVNQQI